jgi:hypothetical protein
MKSMALDPAYTFIGGSHMCFTHKSCTRNLVNHRQTKRIHARKRFITRAQVRPDLPPSSNQPPRPSYNPWQRRGMSPIQLSARARGIRSVVLAKRPMYSLRVSLLEGGNRFPKQYMAEISRGVASHSLGTTGKNVLSRLKA